MPDDLFNISSGSTVDWRKDSRSAKKFQFVRKFLLPHPEYKQRAPMLSHKAFVFYCLGIVLVAGILKLLPVFVPGVLGYASNIDVKTLLEYTNAVRENEGLEPLRLNTKLSDAAQKKAKHMFENGYWAHISPDGTEPWDFILGVDYDYIYAGENLAKNFSTSRDVVEAWYNSPSHKENLMSSKYDEIGFAVVDGILDGYETTLVVQMFGRPRSVAQVASVYEEQELLKTIEEKAVETNELVVPKKQSAMAIQRPEVLPLFDVATVNKSMSILFGGFVVSLFGIDLWYTRRKGIVKVNGHTLAHLSFLVMILFSIWFVIRPGNIL